MNGVEILAEEVIYKLQPFNIFFLGTIIISIPCLIRFLAYAHKIHQLDAGLVILALILVLAIGLVCGTATMATPLVDREVKYIEYKVTIDESVSMVEFLDKYEILDQEGKIYTVKERE
jgi:uncharacterized membrane protein